MGRKSIYYTTYHNTESGVLEDYRFGLNIIERCQTSHSLRTLQCAMLNTRADSEALYFVICTLKNRPSLYLPYRHIDIKACKVGYAVQPCLEVVTRPYFKFGNFGFGLILDSDAADHIIASITSIAYKTHAILSVDSHVLQKNLSASFVDLFLFNRCQLEGRVKCQQGDLTIHFTTY